MAAEGNNIRLNFGAANAAAERIYASGGEITNLQRHQHEIEAGSQFTTREGDPIPQIMQWYGPQSQNMANLMQIVGEDLQLVGEKTREAMGVFSNVSDDSARTFKNI